MIRRSKLFRLTGGVCWYCGQPAKNRDHVIPRSRGGPNSHDNLVPACTPCNDLKRNMTVDEFREKLKQRWHHAQTDRRAMKRPVALFGSAGFKFYFEIAGLSQPVIPEDRLAQLKPRGYSLLKRGTSVYEEPPHTTFPDPPTCLPIVG